MIEDALKDSYSMRDVLRKLGISTSGGNYTFIKRLMLFFEINPIEFKKRTQKKPTANFITKDILIEKYLILGSTMKTSRLKHKLIIFGIKKRVCERCNITSWRGVELALELHHINHNPTDGRLENLEILCPNCHTLEHRAVNVSKYGHKQYNHGTPTSIKKKKDTIPRKYTILQDINCAYCNKIFHPTVITAKYCSTRCHSKSREKISWPSDEELKRMVWEMPTLILAKQLGVSDKAVSKRCKKLAIEKPPRGYWAKQVAIAC